MGYIESFSSTLAEKLGMIADGSIYLTNKKGIENRMSNIINNNKENYISM